MKAPRGALQPAIVVLISGRGSNLAALLEAELPVSVAAVISNRSDAGGLAVAAAHAVPTAVLDHRAYADREAFDRALAGQIDAALGAAGQPDQGLVVLAGFMRIFSAGFTAHYAGRMINIHPSLLPAFTGLHTHRRALQAGVRLHGCTVHYVTAELDHGPVIAQAAVPVLADDDETRLADRVLAQEHQLYPQVVRAWADGRLALGADGRVRYTASIDPSASLRVPQ
jgi:phosphoribosylglycinamide formyltransferase-1